MAYEVNPMRILRPLGSIAALTFSLVLLSFLLLPGASAQTATSAIKETMQQQAEAWNRGDVDAFMRGYEDSPQTTFIGKTVEHGYGNILAAYKKKYASKEAMGTLEFTNLDVRELDAQFAVVTGNFHLARSEAAGGEAKGVFSLVWEKTSTGWKTILDHTS